MQLCRWATARRSDTEHNEQQVRLTDHGVNHAKAALKREYGDAPHPHRSGQRDAPTPSCRSRCDQCVQAMARRLPATPPRHTRQRTTPGPCGHWAQQLAAQAGPSCSPAEAGSAGPTTHLAPAFPGARSAFRAERRAGIPERSSPAGLAASFLADRPASRVAARRTHRPALARHPRGIGTRDSLHLAGLDQHAQGTRWAFVPRLGRHRTDLQTPAEAVPRQALEPRSSRSSLLATCSTVGRHPAGPRHPARNANNRHPDILAAQRRERARSERHQRWGRPRPQAA